MKKILLLTALFATVTLSVSAQTKKEKIIELFKLMKVEDVMRASLNNMATMSQKMNPGFGNTTKDSLFNAYVKEETIAFSKKIFERDMVEMYDKYFTMAEIQKYIDFYKTPEGQKMMTVSPVIQKDLMTNVMSKDMPELQAKFKKKLEELDY